MRTIRLKSEHNRSCIPSALSSILNIPYNDINAWLRINNYRKGDNRGTHTSQMDLSQFGFRKLSGYDNITVNQFQRLNLQGVYFILVNNHGLGMKNGIAYDTIDSMKRKIKEVYVRDETKLPYRFYEDIIHYNNILSRKQQFKIEEQKKYQKVKLQKEQNKQIKLNKTKIKKDPQYQIDQLLKRKKTWTTKLSRAKTAISKIEKKIKYYETRKVKILL